MARSDPQLGLTFKGTAPTKDMLLAVLQKHIGRECGLTAAAVAATLGTNARLVRLQLRLG